MINAVYANPVAFLVHAMSPILNLHTYVVWA
jgi:hypothetical protein